MRFIKLKMSIANPSIPWMLLSCILSSIVGLGFSSVQVQAQDESMEISETVLADDKDSDNSSQEPGALNAEVGIEEVYITGSLLPKGSFEA